MIDAGTPMGDADPPSPVGPPDFTFKGMMIVATAWGAYTLIYSVAITQMVGVPFREILASQIFSSLILALYSLPIWVVVVRRMDRRPIAWKIAAHLFFAPLYAIASYASIYPIVGWFGGAEARAGMTESREWIVLGFVWIYAAQFALYHGVRIVGRLRKQERLTRRMEALAREQELAVLRSQLNPHFLFNTLNGISATIGADPERAREMVAQLGDLLRYALDSHRREYVLLREELDFIKAYVALEQVRFGERLRVIYDIDSRLLDLRVPPVILQPLVENAIKHGIAHAEQGGTVTIRVCRDDVRNDGGARFCVSDTGTGDVHRPGRSTSGSGTGLQNINGRLRGLYGEESTLHIETDNGFRVSFTIPAEGY